MTSDSQKRLNKDNFRSSGNRKAWFFATAPEIRPNQALERIKIKQISGHKKNPQLKKKKEAAGFVI